MILTSQAHFPHTTGRKQVPYWTTVDFFCFCGAFATPDWKSQQPHKIKKPVKTGFL
jgi:hypothetical protein